jgi:imidazolonepropionase-like amidohydrolase
MPGLIDVHCHLTYGEATTEEEIDLYTSHEMRTLLAAANATKVLRAGVTSMSQPGGSYNIGVAIRDAVDRGLVHGPRITSAGRYLTTSNGLTDWFPDDVGVPAGSIGTVTNTVDEMRTEIRRQVKAGVDLVKVSDSPFGQFQAFTADEMQAICDLAHQLGIATTIHARGSAEVSAAVAAGFDWIMHGNLMDDDVIEQLAESRITLVPTLLYLANIADWPQVTEPTRAQVDGCRWMLERTGETLHKAHEAGVTFAVGTDTGFAMTPYGEWHARELELLVTYAGLSNLEAIAAATVNGAPMLNKADELGRVATGHLADLLLVDGDPTANLRVLLDPDRLTVIKGGQIQEFEDGLEDRHFRNDSLPNTYTRRLLTKDVIFDGADPVRDYQHLPWGADEAADLFSDLQTLSPASMQGIGH